MNATAPLASNSHRKHGWAPITNQRGGEPSELVVTPVSTKGPHAVAHSDARYLLDSGDQLRVFVYGQPNLSRIYTVDHSGNIMVPLIGIVRAQRRTTYELAGAIRARLGARFVRDPNVTVDMHQNRPFFILGEVRTPGQYPYVPGMTVETAVAIAGGYTPRADKHRFRVNRRVDGVVEVDHGPATYVLQPGDTINVSERFF
ncbi:MAG: polysaccharide export protein [Hyphomicrobiaceae bacterium]